MALTVTDLLNAIMGGGQTSITATPPIVITPPSGGNTMTLSGSSGGDTTATITPPLSFPQPSDALAAMNLAVAAFSSGHTQLTSSGQTTFTPPATNTPTNGSNPGTSSGGSLYISSGGMSTVTVAPLSGMAQTVTNIVTAAGSLTLTAANPGNWSGSIVSGGGGASLLIQGNTNPVSFGTIASGMTTVSLVSPPSGGGLTLSGGSMTVYGGTTLSSATLRLSSATLTLSSRILSIGTYAGSTTVTASTLNFSQLIATGKAVTLSPLVPNGLTVLTIPPANIATSSSSIVPANTTPLTVSGTTLSTSHTSTISSFSEFPATISYTPVPNTLTIPAASPPTPPVVDVTGSTLVNNGVMQGVVNVGDGGVLKGNGTFDTVNAGAGGTVSPGNSPGTMTDTNTTWGASSTYVWQINDLSADQASGHTGTAGGGAGHDGWDLWNVGELTFVPGFAIEAHSITVGDADAAIADFNAAQHYQWEIATSNGNFTPDVVSALNSNLNATAIASSNGVAPGRFDLFSSDMSGLYLEYTPVPEPGTLLLAGCAAAGLAWRARRRRAANESGAIAG